MKSTFARRYRRRSSSSREVRMLKKDNQHEQTFFGGPSQESFLNPMWPFNESVTIVQQRTKK